MYAASHESALSACLSPFEKKRNSKRCVFLVPGRYYCVMLSLRVRTKNQNQKEEIYVTEINGLINRTRTRGLSGLLEQTSETRTTASVLKQDPNAQKV